jgi:hypothetical protein
MAVGVAVLGKGEGVGVALGGAQACKTLPPAIARARRVGSVGERESANGGTIRGPYEPRRQRAKSSK